MVPEHDRVEQQILTGEAPDPTHIPAGCRFHPRCPVYQSGEAERLGILDACTGSDPVLIDGVACHATNPPSLGAKPEP